MTQPFSFHELTSPADQLLIPWLALYEQAFPPTERIPAAVFLQILHDHANGVENGNCLQAVQNEAGALIGLVHTYRPGSAPVVFLWYFATLPELRGGGLGAAVYRQVLDRLRAGAMAAVGIPPGAMIYDVEDPEEMDGAAQAMARRRIEFYRRQGARLLGGARTSFQASDFLPEISLRLIVHPLVELSPQDAFELARPGYGEGIRQVGELMWE